MIEQPRVIQTTAERAAVIRVTVPRHEIASVMGPTIEELMSTVVSQGISPAGPLFSHHLRMDPAVFDFEVGVPVSKPVAASGRVKAGELPAARVAQTTYRGAYEGLGEAWGEFGKWLDAEGHVAAPDMWERYVIGPETSSDPADWRTELNRPLQPDRPA